MLTEIEGIEPVAADYLSKGHLCKWAELGGLLICLDKIQGPYKDAISCQYRACTGPMLAASAQYRPGTGR